MERCNSTQLVRNLLKRPTFRFIAYLLFTVELSACLDSVKAKQTLKSTTILHTYNKSV